MNNYKIYQKAKKDIMKYDLVFIYCLEIISEIGCNKYIEGLTAFYNTLHNHDDLIDKSIDDYLKQYQKDISGGSFTKEEDITPESITVEYTAILIEIGLSIVSKYPLKALRIFKLINDTYEIAGVLPREMIAFSVEIIFYMADNDIQRALELLDIVETSHAKLDVLLKIQYKTDDNSIRRKIFNMIDSIQYPVATSVTPKRTIIYSDILEDRVDMDILGEYTAIAITPNGKYIIFASSKNTIKIFDIENYKIVNILHGHSSTIASLLITADGNYIFSGSDNGTIKLWDIETGEKLYSFKGHKGVIDALEITRDGKYLISGGFDLFICGWDIAKRKLAFKHSTKSSIEALSLINNDAYLAIKRHDYIYTIELKSGDIIKSFGEWSENEPAFSTTPDKKYILTARYDHIIELLDIEDGKLVCSFKGHTDYINSIAVTPDGRFVVSGGDDMTIRVWDIKSGLNIHIIEGCSDVISSIIITPDGKHIIASCNDSTIRIWDIENIKEIGYINAL